MKHRLRPLALLLLVALSALSVGCGEGARQPSPAAAPDASGTGTAPRLPPFGDPVVTLTFDGKIVTPSVADAGVVAEGNAFLLTKPGVYELTGQLTGQLRVSVAKSERVRLILNGFTASSATSAPLYVESADRVSVELARGTVNCLSDADIYQFEDPMRAKPNACLYSSEDLTIGGEGTLRVEARYNNGIGCKNDLRIVGGRVEVSAPHNILKGNGSVTVEGGTLSLTGGENAVKADAVDRPDKGFVHIMSGAVLDIDCFGSAFQAVTRVVVERGATVRGVAGSAVRCAGETSVDEAAVAGLLTASAIE